MITCCCQRLTFDMNRIIGLSLAIVILIALGCTTRQGYEARQQMRGGAPTATYYGDGELTPAQIDMADRQSRVIYYHPDGSPAYQQRSYAPYTGEQNLDPYRNQGRIYSDRYGRPTTSVPVRGGVTDGDVIHYNPDGTVGGVTQYRDGQQVSP